MGVYVNNTFIPAIKINQPIVPSSTLSIDSTGFYDVHSYSSISVNIEDLLDKKVTTGLSNYMDYTDLSASRINDFAFVGQKINNINMPNVTSIGRSAFYNISFSSNIIFNFPNCTYLGPGAFGLSGNVPNPSNLMTISINSNISSVPSSCFFNNTFLSSINTLNCTEVYPSAFYHCDNLTSISLPSCVNIYGNYAFGYCSKLTDVSVPVCKSFGYYAFTRCIKLSTISMPACTSIGNYVFSGCYNLLSVYLNVSAVPSLGNINTFSSTPISNYTTSTGGIYGSIFVPTSLYSSFISATNWANYSSRIVSMNF